MQAKANFLEVFILENFELERLAIEERRRYGREWRAKIQIRCASRTGGIGLDGHSNGFQPRPRKTGEGNYHDWYAIRNHNRDGPDYGCIHIPLAKTLPGAVNTVPTTWR